MAYTDIDICSNALIRIGGSSISSFEESTAEAEVAKNLYSIIKNSLISSYPWNFALRQQKLNKLEEAPIADFQYAYFLPTDCLRVISAGYDNRTRGLSYVISENKLYSNVNDIVIQYVASVEEESMPSFFVEMLIGKLASDFCLSLTESTSRAEFLLKRFEDDFKRAKLIDAQQSTTKTFEDFSLIDVRG
ncbi:MAG: hypothetical protein R3Y43_02905 [Alphaproteobacteria bacterium]